MAAQWSSTSVSFLKGSGYELASSEDATIMTLEHASGWEYGDNFFFLDVFQPFDTGNALYGEWHPRLNLGKVFNRNMAFGPVSDVLLAGEINYGCGGTRVYLYGAGFNLNIPKFNFFSLNIYARDNVGANGDMTFQISPAWNIPFNVGSARFECGGFLDYSGADTDHSEAQLLFVPQVLLDLGNFQDAPGRIYAGIEYQYWKNKYGVDGFDDNLVQAMVKWFF
ncbi:ion channel protein Tsx [bacterium DOLJORAL78_65_58]|nr:MAG: ion channel protein Tsx [bacterium DOLJORAL78_65_58]